MPIRSLATVALIASSLASLACGTRAIPSGRSPSPSPNALGGPGTLVLVASLHSGPSVSGATAVGGEDACRGTATVTLDPNPQGALNLASAVFQISLIGCPPGTTLTSVHIHRMPIGTVEEWIGSGLPEVVLRNGDGSYMSTNQGIPLARAQAVIDDPTGFYIHFHSRNNQAGGFLRGELAPR